MTTDVEDDVMNVFTPLSATLPVAAALEKTGALNRVKSDLLNSWKALSGHGDDHKSKEPGPGIKTDVLISPMVALPPPVNDPEDEDELSVIPTTGDTPSVQGSTGQKPEDPLNFRYDDTALVSPGLNLGLTFNSNDEKRTHSCVVGAWIDSKRDIKCSFTVFHLL